jgi:hypothetical protein
LQKRCSMRDRDSPPPAKLQPENGLVTSFREGSGQERRGPPLSQVPRRSGHSPSTRSRRPELMTDPDRRQLEIEVVGNTSNSRAAAAPARSLNRWLAASALRKNCARRIIRTEVVRPVDGEALRQPDARTIDPALDRSNRAIANGSGLQLFGGAFLTVGFTFFFGAENLRALERRSATFAYRGRPHRLLCHIWLRRLLGE